MKKIILLFAQSIFGLILLVIFLRTNDLSNVPSYFSRVSIPFSILIAMVYILAAIFRFTRFKILLSPLKKIKFQDAVTTSFVGTLLNYLVPLRLGELGRGWFIKRKYNLSLVSGTTASFVDKIFDVFAAIILIIVFIPTIGKYSFFHGISYLQIIPLVLIFGLVYLLVFREKLCLNIAASLLFFLPKKTKELIVSLFEKVISGFSILKINLSSLFLLLFLSILALILDGVYFYLIFPLLGFSVSLPLVILGYTLFNLSFIIPAAPGYVGNIELFGIFIFSLILGISKQEAATVIIFHHLLLSFALVIPGFLSFLILDFSKGK